MTVVIDGIAHPTYYGIGADEAVKRLGSSKFFYSGFQCVVPAKELAPGKHVLVLKILTHDRKALFQDSCANQR